jgi:hypothetical protein
MKDVNYNIIQGDSFQLALTYTNSSGSAINLTGYSALMQIKDQPGGRISCGSAGYIPASGSVAAYSDGITITSASGLININLSPAKTRLFNFPKSAYQLQITSSSGVNTTLLSGWFNVTAGVID